jgi:translocation and assembly module TamB
LKALRIGGMVLAVLLLLAAGVFAWAIYTESGARTLLALSERWLPSGLTVGEIRGTVAGTLQVRDLRYRDSRIGMDLRVEDASFETAALALLRRRLHVERARVDGLHLAWFAPAAASPPKPARDPWRAPLDLLVDDLRLARGELRSAGETWVIDRLHVAASWLGRDLEVRALELDGPLGSLVLSGRLAPPAPHLERLQARFRWLAGGHEWTGALAARGLRDALQLDARLDSPLDLKVAATLAGVGAAGRRPGWHAHLSVPRFGAHPLFEGDAFKTLALELDAEGDFDQLALRGTLSVDEDRVAIERLDLRRLDRWLEVAALRLRLNSQPAALTGHAKWSLDGVQPSSAEVAWEEFRLPDAWAGADFRCAGKLAVTASPRGFAMNSQARLARGDRYSNLSLRVDGSGKRLRIQELELTQLPGSLSVTGDVELARPWRWSLAARARAFDPSSFFAAWPGALDFDIDTRGDWPASGPHASFELARLRGKLRARAISGTANLKLGADFRPSGHVKLRSGGASLDVAADSSARPRVDAQFAVASLAEWRDGLHGSLHAQAVSVGRWPQVELEAEVSADGLRHGSTAVDRAKLRVRARDWRAPRGSAELDAGGLVLAGFRFKDLVAKVSGDARAHDLSLEAHGDPTSLSMRLQGSLSPGSPARRRWSGTLHELALTVARVPPLKLAEPAGLAISRDSFELGNACLAGGTIALCAGARRDPRSFSANYSVRALPLGVLVALVSPEAEVSVEGSFEGQGDLRRASDGTYTGRATLVSSAGSLAQRGNEKAVMLEYRDFGVDLDLTPQAARAQLRGTLPRQGELDGIVTLAVAERDPTLAGRAALRLRDLAPLAIWVPQLANFRGSGEVVAEMGGTLQAPRVAVSARATGLDAEVPMLGVHLREGSFDAKLTPDGGFDANGSIRSGDGILNVTGAHIADRRLELKLRGQDFLAASIPGARVTIAPDLSLTGHRGRLELTGSVRIDDAEVNLEKLSFARRYEASPDVVVVDREIEVRQASLGLTTDVRVILGDRVKLGGFGLESTVTGELRVLEERDQPSRATGEIRVAGTYEAFGRKLSISRGRLQFAGTSLDDPQLDILAERKLDDVTAKLRVTGTAQHPTLDVFTDPATSQTDAMAYLITGKAASEAHGEEGAVVSSAAQSVGSVLGNRLAKKLGGKMGFIDEIGVEQNTDLGGNAFTVGKYLSPRFFISYGVGLFEPGSTMTVRYEFSKHWSLEANQAPEDGHAGIRYRIEK